MPSKPEGFFFTGVSTPVIEARNFLTVNVLSPVPTSVIALITICDTPPGVQGKHLLRALIQRCRHAQ